MKIIICNKEKVLNNVKIAIKLALFLIIALVFGNVLFVFATGEDKAASLYLTPSSGSYSPGQSFSVDIMLDTGGNQIQGVAAYIIYDSSQLEAEIDNPAQAPQSVFNEQYYSSKGREGIKPNLIEINRIATKPAIGSNIAVARLILRAKTKATLDTTELKFSFDSTRNTQSQVIGADYKNILSQSKTQGSSYIIDAHLQGFCKGKSQNQVAKYYDYNDDKVVDGKDADILRNLIEGKIQ